MPATTRRTQQALATKQVIFEQALNLFSRRPYEQITVKDICEAAGVSIGAFYHHFKSKENLLDEGYRMYDQELERTWERRRTAGVMGDIHFLVEHQLRSLESMGGYAAAQYFKNQLSAEHAYMLDPSRVLNVRLVEALGAGAAQGLIAGDPAQIAEEILCITRGIIYDWSLHGNSYDLVARGRRLVDILLEHYRAPHADRAPSPVPMTEPTSSQQ